MSEAELYLLKGEALLVGAAPLEARARACFGTAVMIAREQEARVVEVARHDESRAAARQARPPRSGARMLARDLWLYRGLRHRRPKDAKTLLDELAG